MLKDLFFQCGLKGTVLESGFKVVLETGIEKHDLGLGEENYLLVVAGVSFP